MINDKWLNDIHVGHALDILLQMPDEFVNCIVTSPPYWSLRKYDIPDLVWDGVEGCEHEWGDQIPSGGYRRTDTFPRKLQSIGTHNRNQLVSQFCQRCGAWHGQLGLEPTINLYLSHLMQIMDECKRVLRDDGTMWVNIGDSYAGSWGNYGAREGKQREVTKDRFDRPGAPPQDLLPGTVNCGIPPKSTCLIPERFAIEMVDRKWVLRNKIVWHKTNCMPSSVKDRFTVDFEPVFFFVKSRKYWFEQQYDPTIEPYSEKRATRPQTSYMKAIHSSGKPAGNFTYNKLQPQGRNRRCVWTIPTQPYPESHFATFPKKLVEPCIKAGCPEGGIVLDPFGGSGTVGEVANELGRKWILIDAGQGYADMAWRRILGAKQQV